MNEATSATQSAQNALQASAMEKNMKAVTELADSANRQQQNEHIRGIVATTLAHLSSDASAATRELAAQWRTWALGLADGAMPVGT
ncbi:hypothetical protein [Aquabacterium sp.]|uniref:hypothetical protein n=1 Tax=Aquabacterium sp. TaxID=1872578 RepID=UPI003783EF6C